MIDPEQNEGISSESEDESQVQSVSMRNEYEVYLNNCKIILMRELNTHKSLNFGDFEPLTDLEQDDAFPSLNEIRFPREFRYLVNMPCIKKEYLRDRQSCLRRDEMAIWPIIESRPTRFLEFIDRQIALTILQWRQAQLEDAQICLKDFTLHLSNDTDSRKEYLVLDMKFKDCRQFTKIEKGDLLRIEYGPREYQVLKECRIISVTPDECLLQVKYDYTELPENDDLDKLNRRPYIMKAYEFHPSSPFQATIRSLEQTKIIGSTYLVDFDDYEREDPDPIVTTPGPYITEYLKNIYKIKYCDTQAIWRICTSTSKKLPIIVHGPCGVGRIKFIVAAVLCLLSMGKNHRILICTPTNANADTIGLKLMKKLKNYCGKILRLRSVNNDFHNRDKRLDDISCFNSQKDNFILPNKKEEYEKYDVVICTAASSNNMTNIGIPPGFFSHVFIDEASLMRNSDFFIPIGNFVTEKTSVILCGDRLQLSPSIKLGENYISGESILAHYLKKPCYENNPKLTSLLTHSYSLTIPFLNLIDAVFYGGRANFCGRPFSPATDLSPFYLNQSFPITFKQVDGECIISYEYDEQDEEERNRRKRKIQELNRRRYFVVKNLEEAEAICQFVEELLSQGIQAKDIGIVSPYKTQLKLIQSELKIKLESKFPDQYKKIKSNTVERFQGSTRRIILLATTRTGDNMGFLKEKERIYTAITRMTEYLVVFGDPECLGGLKEEYCVRSEEWMKLMEECHKHGTFEGDYFDKEEEEVQQESNNDDDL